VNDGREVAWDLPADAEFLAKARRMVGELLDGWALSGLIENVTLVVTELYANSLVHGEPPITLILRADRRTLRGEITDRGRLRLPATPADLYDEHGRGLAIVAALVDRWGIDPGRPGTTVWFCLAHDANI
jgi:Anti-sigma regulatory factor (Ser/Thr protein kinase)